MNFSVGIERIRTVMIIQSGEGSVPIVGIVTAVVERTAWIVSVEVVVRFHGFGI